MDSLWLALTWGSPIGLGVFFAGLGALFYLTTKADVIRKYKKEKDKE